MRVPQSCASPETPFQELLFRKDFTNWWLFPSSSFPKRRGFYGALSIGVLIHLFPNYSEFPRLIETWKNSINPIITVNEQFESMRGEGKFDSEDYWEELIISAENLCVGEFSKMIKQDCSQMVREKRVPDTSNSAFYTTIARLFKINLCIHQAIANEGVVETKEFNSGGDGEMALFVNLAFEEDSVLVLYHKDFCWGEVRGSRFPNVTRLKKGVESLKLNQEMLVQWASPHDPVLRSLTRIVTILSEALSKCTLSLPASCTSSHSELRNLRESINRICSRSGINFQLESEALELVLKMSVEKASERQRESHTKITCALYPEEGRLLEYHGHSFHPACIASLLEDFRLNFTENIKCPHPGCPHALPIETLDFRPDIKALYEHWRTQTILMASYSKFISLKPEDCNGCGRMGHTAIFRCGCKLCHTCSQSAIQNKFCLKCKTAIDQQDHQSMNLLREYFPQYTR